MRREKPRVSHHGARYGVMAASSTHVRTATFPSASSRSATAPPMDTPYSPQSVLMPRCASQSPSSAAMASTLV